MKLERTIFDQARISELHLRDHVWHRLEGALERFLNLCCDDVAATLVRRIIFVNDGQEKESIAQSLGELLPPSDKRRIKGHISMWRKTFGSDFHLLYPFSFKGVLEDEDLVYLDQYLVSLFWDAVKYVKV